MLSEPVNIFLLVYSPPRYYCIGVGTQQLCTHIPPHLIVTMAMAGVYSDRRLKEYALSSDEDDNVQEKRRAPASSYFYPLSGSKGHHSSKKHKPIGGLVDPVPQNVSIGRGDGLSPSYGRMLEAGISRRSLNNCLSNSNSKLGGDYSDTVRLGEECLDNGIKDHSGGGRGHAGGTKGHAAGVDHRVGGSNDRADDSWSFVSLWSRFLEWLEALDWWKVVLLGCVVAVVLGTLYQGGLTGRLHMGFSFRGELTLHMHVYYMFVVFIS